MILQAALVSCAVKKAGNKACGGMDEGIKDLKGTMLRGRENTRGSFQQVRTSLFPRTTHTYARFDPSMCRIRNDRVA